MQRGTSGDDRHPADWELQREQLSAYLDDELEPAERAALERHLPGCLRCQSELRELRAVRGLLRALPAPALPRSFALPADGPVPIPLPRSTSTATLQRQVARRGPRIAQWGGALAACLGMALLLGSALADHGALSPASGPDSGSAARTNQTTSQSPNATSTGPYMNDHTPVIGTGTTPGVVGTPKATTPIPAPTATPSAPGGQSTSPQAAAESVPPALPITGAGLLVGGAVVFVVGRTSAKRR
jgi:anti-sigma factor RsiW